MESKLLPELLKRLESDWTKKIDDSLNFGDQIQTIAGIREYLESKETSCLVREEDPKLPKFISGRKTPEEDHEKEKVVEFVKPYLYYMPKNQPALNDNCESYEFDGYVNGGCVTAISSTLAMTYKHRSHLKLRVYSDDDDNNNRHSIVYIRSISQPGTHYKMKVVWIEDRRDIILLSFFSPHEHFANFSEMIRGPKEFEWLIALGLSHENEQGRHLTYRSGRICSLAPDKYGRIKTSAVIDGGDSGAPCFSKEGALIGMMVSSRHSSPSLLDEYDKGIIETEIEDASIHPGESLVLSGQTIIEVKEIYYDYPIPERNPLPSRPANRKRKIEGKDESISRDREDKDDDIHFENLDIRDHNQDVEE
uniref:Serine protease n=1 Tax=Acrobeloides nanus TaxID=290746 RepID=A0A914CBH5_9BILA